MATGIVGVHHYAGTVVDAVALLLNVTLLYLILNYSTFQIRAFKNLFLLTCVGDTLLSLVVLVGQPYFLFDEGYTFFVSNGPFCCRSAIVDHIAVTAYCTVLHLNIVFVVFQYLWRNSLICGHESFIKVRKRTFIVPALWCSVQVGTAVWCWLFDQEELRETGLGILLRNGWDFDNETAPYPALVAADALKTRIHHGFYLCSSVVGYAIIIWCQVGVIRFLQRLGLSFRLTTRKAHAEVNRALVALAITPLCSFIPTAIMIASGAMQIALGSASAYMSLGMTTITLANPLVTMYFIRPYRNGLLRLLRLKRKNRVIYRTSTMLDSSNDVRTH